MSKLLTVKEVADILRVDDGTVRRWITQGVLPAIILPFSSVRQTYRVTQDVVEHILGYSLPQ